MINSRLVSADCVSLQLVQINNNSLILPLRMCSGHYLNTFSVGKDIFQYRQPTQKAMPFSSLLRLTSQPLPAFHDFPLSPISQPRSSHNRSTCCPGHLILRADNFWGLTAQSALPGLSSINNYLCSFGYSMNTNLFASSNIHNSCYHCCCC